MEDTLIFIPSCDRPMQLDCAIRSFRKHCKNSENYEISVLWKGSNERFKNSYKKLEKMSKNDKFIEENVFKRQFLSLIRDKMWILFITDDCVFTNDFDIEICKKYLVNDKFGIGFSLRLGMNTKKCYSLNIENDIPQEIQSHDDSVMSFDWRNLKGDFGYPLEVSSSLYKIGLLFPMLKNCDYHNPNYLEWIMDMNKNYVSDKFKLYSFVKSVAFCNPINKVQETNSNRSGNNISYTKWKLLENFEEGERIDVGAYNNFISNGCHQEVKIDYEK